ncbi:MAG: histidine kinase [Eubacteriales bacterium]
MESADRAIQKSAKYLRSYLRVINEEENIPIDLELDMVENYLIIEQMRFEDKLSFVVDKKFEDSEVPPLSVQTLVENAVVHGIQKQTVKGKVIVTTRKNGIFNI